MKEREKLPKYKRSISINEKVLRMIQQTFQMEQFDLKLRLQQLFHKQLCMEKDKKSFDDYTQVIRITVLSI